VKFAIEGYRLQTSSYADGESPANSGSKKSTATYPDVMGNTLMNVIPQGWSKQLSLSVTVDVSDRLMGYCWLPQERQ
jgi:hypothetical protein